MTSNMYDPLKYCHINYMTNSIDYNNYINKLININASSQNNKNILIADYLYINVDNNWKKLWLVLKKDQSQLELYQSKTNLKPFDSINLINDRVLMETNIKQIKKILVNQPNSFLSSFEKPSNKKSPSIINLNEDNNQDSNDNIYEELNETSNFINFEQSSLIILLYNNKLCLKIGFTSFNKKNIWYDALQSSILIGQSVNLSKKSHSALNTQASSESSRFKIYDINNVLKPFLELCDTVVNSYCFINENLIALGNFLFVYFILNHK